MSFCTVGTVRFRKTCGTFILLSENAVWEEAIFLLKAVLSVTEKPA